ncbi:uncharacterized protein LOC120083141 [Benincasa hispida]|uniref:uncharacterized protein LOC120083141 n=1 Tax=Benincasa hispida TaxID=102211 RepID=UPI00190286A4|nr:uncharacterized protein LOC120083141 [Benincasa hispida]
MDVPPEKYFPATVSCQVHKTAFVIKNKLTEEQIRLYRKIVFGPLLWLIREIVERETSGERLRELILGPKDPNEKDSSCKDVEIAFEKFNFTNDENVVNLALALFIETVMIGKDKKTQFDVNIFGIADDLEVFVHYNWKNEAYDSKKAENDHRASYYYIKGFALAFQYQTVKYIWVHCCDQTKLNFGHPPIYMVQYDHPVKTWCEYYVLEWL